MQRVDQCVIDLEHRLAPGQHDEPMRPLLSPKVGCGVRQRIGISELAAAQAIGPDKLGIAEFADRSRAILFAAGPEVAPGEADEHRARAGIHPLPLKGQEHLLDRIAHADRLSP